MAEAYAGIDVGLTGARATLLSPSGRILAHSRIAAHTDALSADDIVALACKAMRMAMAGRGKHHILGLAVCCFGPSPVLLARDGKAIHRIPLLQHANSNGPDDLRARVAASGHRRAKAIRS